MNKLLRNKISAVLISVFIFSPVGLAESKAADVAAYDDLIQSIYAARQASDYGTGGPVEDQKVREAWKIGAAIGRHILAHKDQPGYEKQVIAKLADNVGIGITEEELSSMVGFARAYPGARLDPKLNWHHYQALIKIGDARHREALEKQASGEGWTSEKLAETVAERLYL